MAKRTEGFDEWKSGLHSSSKESSCEESSPAKNWSAAVLGLAALCGLTFFVGLGGLPMMGPDEPRYAEVAREMFASGDYISPRLCGYLWFEKPAWLYWMQAASYHGFGVNEFAARLPSALAALATVLFVALALWRTLSPRLALAAGGALATTSLWLGMARGGATDMPLAAAVAVAVLAAYLALAETGRARFAWCLLCAAATGVSMLAKGLVGVLLVTLIVGLYVLAVRRFNWRAIGRHWPHLLAGALLFVAVVATWYAPVTLEHGRVFIDEFFVNHHFKRYLTDRYSHTQPFYFYFLIAAAGLIPWSFFLMPALARVRNLRPRLEQRDSLLLLAWIWALVPILFFSLSSSKLPAYILPSFPALAILAGAEIERIWNGERTLWGRLALGGTALLLLAAGFAFTIYLQRKGVAAGAWQTAVLWTPLLVGALSAIACMLGRAKLLVLGAGAVVASVVIAAVLIFFPVSVENSLKPFSLRVAAALQPGEEIVFYRKTREYAPIFYCRGRFVFFKDGRLLQGLSSGDEIAAANPAQLLSALHRAGEQSLVVITDAPFVGELKNDARWQTEPVVQQDSVVALRLTPRQAQSR